MQLGNSKLLGNINQKAENVFKDLSENGKTIVGVKYNSDLIGVLGISDTVKKTSKEAIKSLKERGIKTYLITGDNEKTAAAVAKKVGIENVLAEVLPENKESKVQELKKDKFVVAMVGDGINDSPALAAADIGIAIGSGTDIAIEAADVILMKDDLNDVVNAIDLSRITVKNIKQNLFWAFFYNVIGIPIAAGLLFIPFGLKLDPMLAGAAMAFSSVTVVTNALRLKRVKLSKSLKDKKRRRNNMKLFIDGMMCDHCENRVRKTLENINGIDIVNINLKEGTADIVTSNDIEEALLEQKISDVGYTLLKIDK